MMMHFNLPDSLPQTGSDRHVPMLIETFIQICPTKSILKLSDPGHNTKKKHSSVHPDESSCSVFPTLML